MTAVDFDDWAAPDLVLTIKGNEYRVPPPCTIDAKKILAAAALGEIRLGLVSGEASEEVQRILTAVRPDDHFALTNRVYEQMVADRVAKTTIDRMAYYAVFYWARGKQYADMVASLMWSGEIALEAAAKAADELPKAPRSSRPKTGSSTA
ncbi:MULTISPECIES: DUF7426 family protein [unclassified Microbacterium]|uniref:DUF7426 family protein n=1 Tax=unclassified Microbacterium TaxID=2609290 RepID=UPI003C2EB627